MRLLGAPTLFVDMAGEKQTPLDEDTKRAIKWVRALLDGDPKEFERWANETLDMSRMRRR